MNEALHRRGLLACAGLAALGAARADDEAAAKPARPPLERVAPDASLGRQLDGSEPRLSDYEGRVVVVSFWATWCPYCREEFPYLDALQRAGRDRLQVVSVNTEERDVFRKVARLLSEQVKLTLTYDPAKASRKAFEAPGSLPYSVILHRDRSVAGIKTGWGEGSLKNLVATVNAALAADAA
ncbi:TlpA family protein disulfide reductase [Roseateles saccharophilus]|uniref:Thiol-disulfide isomerase/thioredoxin n=1 Tax=Roseateles saccharophilus TaxID=304 RepID=A0A4R3UD81_ROSSA|nr:TlpA disulfide reductase family protein [Roseateles saccharophilus]TCU87144.1 thiol-disulfide isomerase/thioredoxin [Roseateles saccharophilus]